MSVYFVSEFILVVILNRIVNQIVEEKKDKEIMQNLTQQTISRQGSYSRQNTLNSEYDDEEEEIRLSLKGMYTKGSVEDAVLAQLFQ